MSKLVELVFEAVSKKEIGKFSDYLLKDSEVCLAKFTNTYGEESIIKNMPLGYDIDVISSSNPYHIMIKAPILTLGAIKINNADIWIEFNLGNSNDKVDVLINFVVSNVRDFMVTCMLDIMTYANNLNKMFTMENYYCGLEPAIDKDTRFFTKTQIGLLRLKEVGK